MENNSVLILRRKLDLLLRTGQLLMESAANTNRIERNMKRVALYMGIPEDNLHLDIRWTMLLVNVSNENSSFSKFQKCEKHGVNMTTIALISKLSWRAIEEDYSLEKYEQELEKIANRARNYSHSLVYIGAGLACGGFCKLFGCDWIAFIFASICASIGIIIRNNLIRIGVNHYISIIITAFIATLIAYATSFVNLSSTPYHPLLACTLFLIPGVPLINFIDDMIDNHLLVGITRASNATMMVGSMTTGISFAIALFRMNNVEIGHQFGELSLIPHDSYIVSALAASIAAVGFSIIFNVERRILWAIAIGGIISVCTRNFFNFQLGYGPIVGSFIGAILVSIIAVKGARWLNVPHHVISIPSVIPMIPGVLMYRSILGFIDLHGVLGETTAAFYNGITAGLILLCISVGVALPNIFARRYNVKIHKKKLEQLRQC